MKKIKFSNISTTQSSSAKRKGKLKVWKTFGFASLALLMAAGGTFAFAPLVINQQANSLVSASEISTEANVALVLPKKDDPVIATTESGIEIKWGNAASASGGGNESGSYSASSYDSALGTPSNIKGNLTSGNLSGFPYFTTSKNGTTYTWVIIGRNSNVTSFNSGATISGNLSSSKIEYKTLSDWKSKINSSDTYANMIDGYSPTYKHFFNSTYESNTPAGAAINSHLDKEYGARNYSASLSYSYPEQIVVSSVKTSTEIPAGCVLCLSNNVTSGSQTWSGGHWDNTFGYTGAQNGNAVNKTKGTCRTYYSDDTFGFGSKLSLIQSVTLTQYGCFYGYYSGSSGSMGTITTTASTSEHFFPLGNNTSYDNFRWQTYLTADQVKTAYNVWARTSVSLDDGAYYITTSGGTGTNGDYQSYGYVRPACVIKFA